MLRWLPLAWLLTVPTPLLAPVDDVVDAPAPVDSAAPLKFQPQQVQQTNPPARFDQGLERLERSQPEQVEVRSPEGLDQLERNRVITPQERDLQGTGRSAQGPIDVTAFQKACQEGALTKQECTSGVARRPGSRRNRPGIEFQDRSTDGSARAGRDRGLSAPNGTPLTVPVSALLAGEGGRFSLQSVFAVTPRPLPSPGNGDRRLLFPVLGEAFTSSGFGWRLHPVLGTWLMHAGQDFAAPQGAPVVASLSGRVVSSGLAGGYGITVVIEHEKPLRRTLYGHLSEIYVKAGQSVRQGEVIGRVGSTGLSTGPHLHFELRRPDAGGWVATNPDDLDMGQLVKQMARQGDDAVSILVSQLLRSLERPDEISSSRPEG